MVGGWVFRPVSIIGKVGMDVIGDSGRGNVLAAIGIFSFAG